MRGVEQIPWLYDSLCALAEWTGLGRWRRWLVEGARGQTLDVGCGTGRNLPLYGSGVTVVGLDPAWEPLLRARRRAPTAWLVVGSAEALPFRDGVFDTVVSALVFCSVSDPRRGLSEVRRILRPGGTLRMLEHVRSTRPWKARLQDRIQPFWTRLMGGCHPNRETERAVEAADFLIDPEGRRAKGDMRRFAARPPAR
ncbi:MAG: class I SAM-dependent methyltransferase [Candidatus Rokubacteria bacterium]|nr:class I SAM-dependent methyltransferase [Candidatus Rokubacteria bacterium]